jgi:CheY-like chemotaxis protein
MTAARDNAQKRKSANAPEEAAPAANASRASEGARQCLVSLTNDFRLFCDAQQREEQIELIGRMQQGVKAVRDSFSAAGLKPWAQFAASVSTLLFAMSAKPGFPTFSAFRSMADALDLLRDVINSGVRWNGANEAPMTILVAAQDKALRQSFASAFQRQEVRIIDCADATAALNHLAQNPAEVVFYDTTISEMDEFSFSLKLRKLRAHARTPLLLVTPLPDFERRCSSLLSDACDFIAQPVVPSEAAVKAYVFGLKYILAKRYPGGSEAAKPAAPAEPEVEPADTAEAEPQPAPAQPKPAAATAPAAPPNDSELRLEHERAAAEWAQARARLERELEDRSSRLEQAERRATELDSSLKSLNLDLAQTGRREAALKKESASLDQQIERLNQTIEDLRQELARETELRLTAERQIEQLGHRLREATQSETALKRELEQSKQEFADTRSTLENSLKQETDAHREAEQAAAKQASALARLEKLLGDSRLQAQQARESAAAVQQARRRLQTELRDVLERQAQLDHQAASLEQQLAALGQNLKSGAGQ